MAIVLFDVLTNKSWALPDIAGTRIDMGKYPPGDYVIRTGAAAAVFYGSYTNVIVPPRSGLRMNTNENLRDWRDYSFDRSIWGGS